MRRAYSLLDFSSPHLSIRNELGQTTRLGVLHLGAAYKMRLVMMMLAIESMLLFSDALVALLKNRALKPFQGSVASFRSAISALELNFERAAFW